MNKNEREHMSIWDMRGILKIILIESTTTVEHHILTKNFEIMSLQITSLIYYSTFTFSPNMEFLTHTCYTTIFSSSVSSSLHSSPSSAGFFVHIHLYKKWVSLVTIDFHTTFWDSERSLEDHPHWVNNKRTNELKAAF